MSVLAPGALAQWSMRMDGVVGKPGGVLAALALAAGLLGSARLAPCEEPPPEASTLPTAELIAGLKDRDCKGPWSPEGEALAARGADAAPALVAALAEPDTVRCNASRILGLIGEPALPAVVDGLHDVEHPVVRREALVVLARMGSAARPAVGTVVEALKDPALRVRACQTLRAIG